MKKIIINADDFGLSRSVNQAIIDVYLRGNLTSATLMVNMPGTLEAVAMAKAHPGLSVGLHFCLTEGQAMTGMSSLTDASGRFFSRQALIARCASGKVRQADIRREFQAQVDFFAAHGLTLAHIDSHQHCHMMPVIFFAILGQINRIGVPLRLAFANAPLSLLWRRPVRFFKQAVLICMTTLYKTLLRVPTNDALVSIHDLDKHEFELADYTRLVAASQGRVVELFVHPYQLGKDLHQLYDGCWEDHAEFIGKCHSEYQVLTGQDVVKQFNGEITVYAKI